MNMFLLAACALLILLAPFVFDSFGYEKPEKAPYKGVITLWNVNAWRTGGSSLISFLKKRISEFESNNPYLFIEAYDMTPAEARGAVFEGRTPDLLSYPSGFEPGFELAPLPAAETVFPRIPDSYPYMCGCYVLMVNTAMLDEKGLPVPEGWGVRPDEFAAIAQYGVAFDSEPGFSPLPAAVLNEYPEETKRLPPLAGPSPEPSAGAPVYYFSEGLAKFRDGSVCALIASHRQLSDLAQLYLDNGAPQFRAYALSAYTDMVQLIGAAKCDDPEKAAACSDFAAFLLRPSAQSRLEAAGVLPAVRGLEIYKENECMSAQYTLFCSKTLFAKPAERGYFEELARKALGGDKKALADLRALAGR